MVMPQQSIPNKSRGRQKIPIKKIEVKSKQQVTFSKRRGGLFKKAGELCVLCGAEVAIIVLSPAEKAFAFGHPNVDAIIERYLTGNTSNPDQAVPNLPHLHKLNLEYEAALKELEEEKKKQEEAMNEPNKAIEDGFWWDRSIDEMNLEDLEEFVTALKELRINLVRRVNEMERKSSIIPWDGCSSMGPFEYGYGHGLTQVQNWGFGSESGSNLLQLGSNPTL